MGDPGTRRNAEWMAPAEAWAGRALRSRRCASVAAIPPQTSRSAGRSKFDRPARLRYEVPMFSMTALLASLPPASLAETDLPRFVSRAFGRRLPSEIPGLRALLDEEVLSGYPPAVGLVLAAFAAQMVAEGHDPRELDPTLVERALRSVGFLEALEARADLERQVLRPGVILTTTVRDVLGDHLRVLPGAGPQLALVAPLVLVRLSGVRLAVPRGPVLARPMEPDEADRLRAAWSTIEEAFPMGDPEHIHWVGRFVRLAMRPTYDVGAAVDGLRALPLARRRGIWRELVEHLRDQELAEAHRPGPRGLAQRLRQLGFEPEAGWVEPLAHLAGAAFEAAGFDPLVARGVCAVEPQDVERYTEWVEVAGRDREILRAMTPSEIEQVLRIMAEIEGGRLDLPLDPEISRAVRSFRDRYLKPRCGRSLGALCGVDPLLLAEARLAAGEDRRGLYAALNDLVEEAAEAVRRKPLVQLPSMTVSPERQPPGPEAPGAEPPEEEAPAGPGAAEVVPDPGSLVTTEPVALGPPRDLAPEAPPPGAEGAFEGRSAPPNAAAPGRLAVVDPSRGGEAVPGGRAELGVRPPRFELPPLPAPPPLRARPRTRPRTGFPPMPSGNPFEAAELAPEVRPRPPTAPASPPRAAVSAEAGGASEAGRSQARSAAPPPADRAAPPPAERGGRPSDKGGQGGGGSPSGSGERPRGPGPAPRPVAEVASPPRGASPRPDPGRGAPVRRRPPTVPHLVTPQQGHEFYEAAFKELEILERDLLQRGPWPAAKERVDALRDEAAELSGALGPSARSGDRAFSGALRRVEVVQAYIERMRPLLRGERPADDEDPAPTRGGGFLGLFRRRRG